MSETLEDFLKQYVRNKQLANSAESYETWLSSYGTDTRASTGEKLADIEEDYARAKSTYGAKAERLAALGLSSSGYGDYLDGVAYAERARAKSAALRAASEDEAANRRGYEAYLSEYRKSQNALLEEAYKTIANSETLDEDAAYRRALGMGLDESGAMEAARGGIALAKEKLRRTLYRTILSEGLDRESAAAFAKSYGFSDEESDAFGDYADIVNRGKGQTKSETTPSYEDSITREEGESFTDYLRRRLAAKAKDE